MTPREIARRHRDEPREAIQRIKDWADRQVPRTDGPRLSEADLFAAYSIGARSRFPVTRGRR